MILLKLKCMYRLKFEQIPGFLVIKIRLRKLIRLRKFKIVLG